MAKMLSFSCFDLAWVSLAIRVFVSAISCSKRFCFAASSSLAFELTREGGLGTEVTIDAEVCGLVLYVWIVSAINDTAKSSREKFSVVIGVTGAGVDDVDAGDTSDADDAFPVGNKSGEGLDAVVDGVRGLSFFSLFR
jgi:hypothetical protein